jgi:hypothetical protein
MVAVVPGTQEAEVQFQDSWGAYLRNKQKTKGLGAWLKW